MTITKTERRHWRNRTTRMDVAYLRLRDAGPATARAVAAETGLEPTDVEELFEDLQFDGVVDRIGAVYFACDNEIVSAH